MKRLIILAALALAPTAAFALTDDQVRERMIQESISAYPGKCPCPYHSMSNGRSCGGRSAYSKPSGASPLCYAQDISDAAVTAYRKQRGIK